jgi:hypothetical protein
VPVGGRGRGRGRGRGCDTLQRFIEEDIPAATTAGRRSRARKGEKQLLTLSVTIVQERQDIPDAAYVDIVQWARDECIAASLSKERGDSCKNLHIQGVVKISSTSSVAVRNDINAVLADVPGWQTSTARITVKSFRITVKSFRITVKPFQMHGRG